MVGLFVGPVLIFSVYKWVLYNLHLVEIVSSNTYFDPKSSFLFCRNLNTSPLMSYSVDCALHRYETSLKNIRDSYFKEWLQLMKSNPKHFPLGIEIFKDGRKCSYRGLVWSSIQWRKFCGHCLAYCSTSSLKKKCSALFRSDGLWKEVLTMAVMVDTWWCKV